MRESDYQFFIASCKSPNLDIEEYELRKALDTIAKHCKKTRCVDCPFSVEVLSDKNLRYSICKLETESPEDYDTIEVNIEVNDETDTESM